MIGVLETTWVYKADNWNTQQFKHSLPYGINGLNGSIIKSTLHRKI